MPKFPVPHHSIIQRPRSTNHHPVDDAIDSESDHSQDRMDYVAFVQEVLLSWRPQNKRRRSLSELPALSQLLARTWWSSAGPEASPPKRRDSAPATSHLTDTITITNVGQNPATRMLVRVGDNGGNGGEEWREVLPASSALPSAVCERLERIEGSRKVRISEFHQGRTLGVWPVFQASMIWMRESWRYAANTCNFTASYVVTFAPNPSDHLNLAQTPSTFLNDTLTWISWIWSWIWFIIRIPLLIGTSITALAVFGLICLQLLAIWYTVSSRIFLNSFCPQSLPVIRNYICSEWDAIAREEFLPPPLWDPRDLQGTISGDITISLTTDLIRLGSQMREVRVRLPLVELKPHDMAFLQDRLQTYDRMSSDTIDQAHITIPYILGTISRIGAFVYSLNASLFEISPLDSTSAVSRSPGFFPSLITDCSTVTVGNTEIPLIWLPLGPLPLLAPSTSELISPILNLRKELNPIRNRLVELQIHIENLQTMLIDMANVADEAAVRTYMVQADTNRDKILRANKRYFWSPYLSQLSLQDHQIASRLAGLERMGPVFVGALQYLREITARVGAARRACETLERSLLDEETMIISGGHEEVSQWVWEQIQILQEAGEVLDGEVGKWRSRKSQFTGILQRQG